MGRFGGLEFSSDKDKKILIAVVIIILILIAFAGLGIATQVKKTVAGLPSASLGVWKNLPPASACSVGNTSAAVCELMGNQSYRGILPNNPTFGSLPGITVNLSVGCITPSNTVGAFLELQYANYSLTTHLNVSNFVNVPLTQAGATAGLVFIDNSANWACSGNLVGSWSSNPLPIGNAYIFRVVGGSGGGTNDNPRFSSVYVHIAQFFERLPVFIARLISATGFTAQVFVNIPSTTIMSASFSWIATNSTSYNQHGSGTCSIPLNTFACTVTVTYPVAFVPATPIPVVIGSAYTPILGTVIPAGIINLLSAQTLTV